jgi:hypothetical protein
MSLIKPISCAAIAIGPAMTALINDTHLAREGERENRAYN